MKPIYILISWLVFTLVLTLIGSSLKEKSLAEKHCQAVESRHEFAKCVEEFKK